MRVTVLSGGVGGARFTRGLLALLRDRLPDGSGGTSATVTVVANTGDDLWLHGVRVCPDLDTLMYTLGGAVHEEQGWGGATRAAACPTTCARTRSAGSGSRSATWTSRRTSPGPSCCGAGCRSRP